MHWKNFIRWASVILGIVVLAGLVGGYFVLKTPWFHSYVISQITSDVQAATGAGVELQNWDVHFFPLTVDLYGIVLHGAEPQNAKPLLQADRLTVGLNRRALLRRKVEFTEILIEHPVANVLVKSDGKNNLPTPPETNTKSNTSVWDLAVEHALLRHGEIYYNDRKTPLDADLHDLRTEIRFDSSATRYTGSLAYRDGHLQYAHYAPLPHSLDAKFSATPAGATLDSLLLAVSSSQISLRGEMTGYTSPRLHADYQALIHTQDFAAVSPGVTPAGDLRLAGEIHYQDVSNRPLLDNASIKGNLESQDLQALSPQGRLALRNLEAKYELANGNLLVTNVAADLLNGRLTAELAMRHLDAKPAGTVIANLQGASIELARESIRRPEVKRMPVTGKINARIHGSWTDSVANIHALSDIGLLAAVWNNSTNPKSAMPVDGQVHLSYDGRPNVLTLHQSILRIPSTSVMVDGQLSGHSDLRIHAVAGDLHELAALTAALQTATSGKAASPVAVTGAAVMDAQLHGPMQAPNIAAQVDAQNLQVQGSQWKKVHIAFLANSAQIRIQQASLVSARQGELNLSAEVGLRNWSYLPANPIRADLSAKAMSLAELEHLANQQYPVSGNLSANVSIRGSQLNPMGHGSVQVVKASAYDQPIQNLTIQFQAANDSVQSTAELATPAGSVSATVLYTPKTKAYKVDLKAPAIMLQKLQTVQAKNLPIAGTLIASASGAGTADNPQLDVVLQIPALQVRQTNITDMKAQLNVRNQRADLAVSSNVTQAFIQAKATVDMTGDYQAQASIDTSKVPLDPLVAVYVPSLPEGFRGETELHATLRGPLKNKSQLEAHVTIPTLAGNYQSLQFSNAGPIRADFAKSQLVVQPGEIRGTETSIRFQGRVPFAGNAGMAVQAQGSVNLKLISIFSSDLKSAGAVEFDVHTAGTIQNPAVQGSIQIKDGALSSSDVPVGLSKLNGTLDVTSDRVQIASLAGEMGGGQISAGGSIAYRPSLQFNVALQGKSVRLLYPDGVRTVLSSNLSLTGNMQAASLNGRALIDSLDFTPDFDLASFATQFNGNSIPPSGQNFTDNIKLGIAVQSSQNLAARSSQLSLEGLANLQVIGTVSDPVIVGRVDLTAGELFFMHNRYQLQRALVTFDDPNQTTPVLNVQATTTIQQYNLTLTLTGPVDKLTTNYVSDPALPTADIISLLYRGQTTEEAAAAGTSTDSLLASQAAGQFSSGIQKLAGISSLQIDPLIGGNNSDPSARVALQQRVTKNFLFTFSTDITQPQSEIIQGEYQINKRWSVSVARDQSGGVSVDGRYHTKF